MDNVKPTIEVIDAMIRELHYTAKSLEKVKNVMERTQDLSISSEAIQTIVNLLPNLRLDLLAARPIRELRGKNF